MRVGKLYEPSLDLIVLKLQNWSNVAKNDVLNHVYDCFSLYRNSDQSYQWRSCRIVRREFIKITKDTDINTDS